MILLFEPTMSAVFPYPSQIVITCFPKQSPWLAKEVESMGFIIEDQSITEVEVKGFMDDCLRLNMYLRTAGRVLFQINRFRAINANELYGKITSMPWENYLDNDGTFSVTSWVRNDTIRDDRFANLRIKDAIADRMVKKTGARPDSGSARDHTVIHVYWVEDKVRLYFDTSGNTISKHGYRKIPFKAPMSESLASSVIMASGWDMASSFVNPMCGSGTLAIEAALMATKSAPGLLRNNYGFMHLKGYDEGSWKGYKRLAGLQQRDELDFKIIATDMSGDALRAAKENARTAGVDHLIEFEKCDFRETPIPKENGVVMMNPEYGERLGSEKDLELLYSQIGDFLKQRCQGYNGYIFTGNLDLAKKIGLKASKRVEFFNARIESRLFEYQLYQGTKREE